MVIFIEGTTDDTNGDLRQGFRKLFEQKLKGAMPRITMGDGKAGAVRKFKSSVNGNTNYLLVDLDSSEEHRDSDIVARGLQNERSSVYYMIQEMEAWFISQPDVLDEFYGEEVSRKLPKKHAKEFAYPDEELQTITRSTKKGKYHKVRHRVELLKLLDAEKLAGDFPDFRNLIQALV